MPHPSLPATAPCLFGRAESDARYGGFDFRAAHEAAPADLRELLDNTESLPFRRRGYERDGMLRWVGRLACSLASCLVARALCQSD